MFTRKTIQSVCLLLFILAAGFVAKGQQWGDYTLYSVSNTNSAYLIDTNSVVYHTWTFSNAPTGYSSYLRPGGELVRSVRLTGNSFTGGGITGKLQKVDWNSNVTWDFQYSSTTYCMHHDICPLPNGNVLLISYESKTAAEVTQAGCSQNIVMWPEKIIEVQQTGATTGTIVWEWHVWDHLVQNVNAAKDNYQTSISAHPELLNINYATQKDWMHGNGLDYNEALDQIAFSSHNLNEIYIIDHSTTTAEAAGHTGGNGGKGGDFLYRWGNPQAYAAGTSANKILNVVHDAHWIPTDCPNAGYLVGFNNKGISNNQSCIDMVSPPLSGYNYTITPGQAYLPSSYSFRQNCNGGTNNMGNSQQLPNGNMLITMALSGTIYEIDPQGNVLWTKTATGQVPQAFRYSACYVNGGTPPTALASASATTICAGDTVQLNVVPGGGSNYTYAWYSSPSGFSSSLQNPSVSPSASTTYYVNVTSGGCTTTANIAVNLNPSPNATINQTGNTLNASPTGATSYQWYLNGSPISGANSDNYSPTQNGDYQVLITDSLGCTGLSTIYTYTVVSIGNGALGTWSIFPNPNSGLLRIEGLTAKNEAYDAVLTDACGKVLTKVPNAKLLDLSNLENGVYFLSLQQGGHHLLTQKVLLLR